MDGSKRRPMRADAARNRARVLEVAYETLATEGTSVSIDEIARRAGVGAGTVWRHFPTKAALLSAVIVGRVHTLVNIARELLDNGDSSEAIFHFLRAVIAEGFLDRSFADAMAGMGIDLHLAAPEADEEFRALLGELLTAAQQSGSIKTTVTASDLKALIVGVHAMQAYDAEVADRVTEMAIAGLRP